MSFTADTSQKVGVPMPRSALDLKPFVEVLESPQFTNLLLLTITLLF